MRRTPSRFEESLRLDYRGFMYQKMASAIRATVMIHRMTSLLPFFSSAMKTSTPQLNFRFKCPEDFPVLATVSPPERLLFCNP
jgi:hypothetical protein